MIVDHQLQCRIDDGARLLGVQLLHRLHRTLDVGEKRGDRLALALGSLPAAGSMATLTAGTVLPGLRVTIWLADVVLLTATKAVPHSPQNFSPGSFDAPHRAHCVLSAAPHSAQKRRPSRLSVPHLPQRISYAPSSSSSALASLRSANSKPSLNQL